MEAGVEESFAGCNDALRQVQKIARYLKANEHNAALVRAAADDLEALCRYKRNVLGDRYKDSL